MTQQASWCSPASPPTPPVTGRSAPRPITLSTLCSLGWRPIMITGLVRDLMIRHFSTPANIEEADLRSVLWHDLPSTGILIESIHRWRGDLVEKRPAVIVKRNAQQNVRLGVADRLGADEQGHLSYQTFWVGSHTLFCIHGSGASVEILATEVQRELTQFARSSSRTLACSSGRSPK
jgi:hypothetical protein